MEPFSIGSVLAAGLRQTPRALVRLAPLLVPAAIGLVLAGADWAPLALLVEVPVAAACAGAGLGAGLRRSGAALLVMMLVTLVAIATGIGMMLPALQSRGSGGIAIEAMGALWLIVLVALYSRWFVAIPSTVIEARGAIASLTRSHALTHGHRGAIAAMLAVVGAIYVLAMLAVERVAGTDDRWLSGTGVVLWLLGATLRANLSAAAFAQLRRDAEGAPPAELGEVFE